MPSTEEIQSSVSRNRVTIGSFFYLKQVDRAASLRSLIYSSTDYPNPTLIAWAVARAEVSAPVIAM
jgi:hypothetical protein